MITFIVRMRFAPEDHDEVESILRELTAASRAEAGCVSYIPHFTVDKPDYVVIYEQYRDEAARKEHRASPHFVRLATGGLYRLMKARSIEDLNAIV
jgi:quinol monooxygenase YgiN